MKVEFVVLRRMDKEGDTEHQNVLKIIPENDTELQILHSLEDCKGKLGYDVTITTEEHFYKVRDKYLEGYKCPDLARCSSPSEIVYNPTSKELREQLLGDQNC